MRTNRLHDKTEDIAQEKDSRELLPADNCMFVSIDQFDDASERHVYCGSKEGRGKQDVRVLNDERHEAVVPRGFCRGFRSSSVSNELDCAASSY